MYCKRCDYNLRGVLIGTCPECGQSFSPDRPGTYRRRPRNKAVGWALLILAVIGSTVVLSLGGATALQLLVGKRYVSDTKITVSAVTPPGYPSHQTAPAQWVQQAQARHIAAMTAPQFAADVTSRPDVISSGWYRSTWSPQQAQSTFRDKLTVTAVRNTQVIQIRLEGPSQRGVQQVLDAAIDEYIRQGHAPTQTQLIQAATTGLAVRQPFVGSVLLTTPVAFLLSICGVLFYHAARRRTG